MHLNKKVIQIEMSKQLLKQQDLADKAGVSRQALSYAMNGRNCRPEFIGRLARALEIAPDKIIE